MRNQVTLILIFCMGLSLSAQMDEKTLVQKTIEGFFEAFHNKDSMAMKSFVAENVVLQTTGRNKAGETLFQTTPIGKLYESIASIPDSVQFQEKLTSWSIQVDRTMANAWVGYEFWLNDNFSHCGINSFQMINFDGDWKIIYLIDTRGKKGCLN